MIEIEPVNYGWLITDYSDDKLSGSRFVVEHQDGETEAAAFVRVLQLLTDQLGPTTSRYSAERVSIGLAPGSKYEDPLPTPASHAEGSGE